MSSDRTRGPARLLAARTAGLVAALALVLPPLLTASPASAAPAVPVAADAPVAVAADTSPGQRIADALRTSQVYVDAAYEGAVPPDRQKELTARIDRTGLPIKVALVPLVKGDAFDGDPQMLADIVHERLGQRELVLITMGGFTDTLNGYEWPDGRHQARDAVSAVGFLDSMKGASLADRVAKAVDLTAQGNGKKVYDDATADLRGGVDSLKDAEKDQRDNGGTEAWLPVTVGVVALALCAGCGFWLVRRRRPSRSGVSTPFAFPQAVFAAARAADEDELRRRAETEVLALGEAVRAADAAAVPELGRALDAYQAAGKVLDGARGLPDLAGVLALVTAGRDALDGRSDALPLCFFDPLHGRAEHRVRWRPLGRRDTLDVAPCHTCAQAIRARRAPEVLTDTGRDGKRVPYFELGSQDSVWAATGYGSLVKSGSVGDMAERVTRGDFTRTRR